MKNFNDVINSVGEAINNAAQSGNIEEMLNNPCKSTRRYNIVPYGLYLARINYN